ncbi:MAG: DUF3427 domain-containing protein [Acidobacteriota bacterium]|nr:DUF3427 domain-containing protein [Acidobacteriota bacterium]
MRREAGYFLDAGQQIADRDISNNSDESGLLNAMPRLLHLDDEGRIDLLRKALRADSPPDAFSLSLAERRTLEGFLLTILPDSQKDFDAGLRRIWSHPAVRGELLELLGVLDDRAEHRTFPLINELPIDQQPFIDVPLSVHARYTRDEVLAAIGLSSVAKRYMHREGPLWHAPTNTDYFFVTIEKNEKYYSPSTRYRDYAISPDVFHWESQSQTREGSPTGQRYINHEQRGSHVMLFVRPRNKDGNRTMAFTFIGPATYIEHTAERPMAILWKLHRAMPLDFFNRTKVAAG